MTSPITLQLFEPMTLCILDHSSLIFRTRLLPPLIQKYNPKLVNMYVTKTIIAVNLPGKQSHLYSCSVIPTHVPLLQLVFSHDPVTRAQSVP